jgi:ferredoxin-type protein NapH
MKDKKLMKKIIIPFLLFLFFLFIALERYISTHNTFYLFNFIYIGFTLSFGIFLEQVLEKKSKKYLRKIILIFVGGYLLIYVGLIGFENLQIEGFFLYLFAGIFTSASLHYFIAKIICPVFFGRVWCGWACWTTMILDLLPYEKPKNKRIKKLEFIKYIHFLKLKSFFFPKKNDFIIPRKKEDSIKFFKNFNCLFWLDIVINQMLIFIENINKNGGRS